MDTDSKLCESELDDYGVERVDYWGCSVEGFLREDEKGAKWIEVENDYRNLFLPMHVDDPEDSDSDSESAFEKEEDSDDARGKFIGDYAEMSLPQ